MCEMCIQEKDNAVKMLAAAMAHYRGVIDIAREQGISLEEHEDSHIVALTKFLTQDVREHYGVLNGQMLAVAIHQLVTARAEVGVSQEQVDLAAMTINEKRRAEGRDDLLTSETVGEILTTVLGLARQ